jgi:phage gp16-like protein
MKTDKNKFWYIKIIHIAKSQLDLDDDLYRSNLMDLTGKNSCSDMSITDLKKVLEHMKKSGFKITSSTANSPKTKDNKDHTMIDKLRQVWIQMGYQGFLKDSSDRSLERWAANQSKQLNNGHAINKLVWINGRILHTLIEQLKMWHMRELEKALSTKFDMVVELGRNAKLSDDEWIKLNQATADINAAPHTHEVISSAYSVYLKILMDHNISVVDNEPT